MPEILSLMLLMSTQMMAFFCFSPSSFAAAVTRKSMVSASADIVSPLASTSIILLIGYEKFSSTSVVLAFGALPAWGSSNVTSTV